MGELYRSELTVPAQGKQLQNMFDFVNAALLKYEFSPVENMTIEVAVEEIFINIASYAYGEKSGSAMVRVSVLDNPKRAVISFVDGGVPYDPLKEEAPDIMLPLEERQIGGLGIFMVKETMDEVTYSYENGCNVLTITKKRSQ